MVSVYDMSSGELLHQECCAQRRVGRRQGAGRLEPGSDLEAGARTHRDEWALSMSPELALLPVASTERR